MKLFLFALLFPLACLGQDAEFARHVAASQKAATALYPDLSRADSDLNKRFVVAYKELRESNAAILATDPNWPMRLARDCAKAAHIDPTPVATPASTPFQDTAKSVEKYKYQILAKIIIFRKDGVIASIKPCWNRHEVGADGHDTAVVYPDKYLVGDDWSDSVFIECMPPQNVASGETTRMLVYPCGMLDQGSARYRKYTTSPQSVLEYLRSGGGPLETSPPYPLM